MQKNTCSRIPSKCLYTLTMNIMQIISNSTQILKSKNNVFEDPI